jgi:hypothetical protein
VLLSLLVWAMVRQATLARTGLGILEAIFCILSLAFFSPIATPLVAAAVLNILLLASASF